MTWDRFSSPFSPLTPWRTLLMNTTESGCPVDTFTLPARGLASGVDLAVAVDAEVLRFFGACPLAWLIENVVVRNRHNKGAKNKAGLMVEKETLGSFITSYIFCSTNDLHAQGINPCK